MNIQIAQTIAENKILHADKMNFYYVIQEVIKVLKKKKEAKLAHAVNMLNNEQDQLEVRKILAEFKIPLK